MNCPYNMYTQNTENWNRSKHHAVWSDFLPGDYNIICRDDYTTAFGCILHYEPTTGTQALCSTNQVQVPFLYKDMLYMTPVTGLFPSTRLIHKNLMYNKRVSYEEMSWHVEVTCYSYI
jgi:hypothetical protein